ncbi:PEP-CTERM protein-sorting domain-containing protein [Nitrosomonas nitrosa]|uniref:PEP-CTERM protein-sorting domain-containing protein n=1 Tax=Nitrosomonas nitrosa TaxID=52442 RepID=A0A1I4U7X6_9PROT|nr:choice-of-anchor E domain-containing protein [Nitrosomonas nitrosa]SFM85074.1 PEP-CTERM protein-sorting domain-containing protein [Nitrosomonas nitrosa]
MKKIKNRFKLLTLGLAIGISGGGIFSSPSAHALAIINTYNFSGSATVTDSQNTGAQTKTTNNNAALGTTAINQFDSSLGVLTGVTVNLTSIQTQTTQTTSTAGGGSGANTNVTSSGTATSSVKLEGAGISYQSANLAVTDDCAGKRKDDCTGAASSNSQNVNTSASPSDLNTFTGTGDITLTRTATTLEATQLSNVSTGTESTQGTVGWDGQLQVTYDYLLHAAPSFSETTQVLVLDVDFGTLAIGGSATQSFDLFNLASINRTGLDLDSWIETDLDNKFAIDDLSFTNLSQGASSNGLITFDTSNAGNFNASFVLNLSDANIGASDSWHHYQLTLNIRGIVGETTSSPAQVNDIPEPGMLALLSIGLFGLLGLTRRRN